MSDLIINTTDATFEVDVIERSKTEPVVVDFWADWCQPCRMLTPVLEKMAEEFSGRVRLVKANTEQCAEAAGEFGVTGIPAIFGVAGGEVVDGIQGYVDESVLSEFFSRMVTLSALAEAKQLEDQDCERSLEIYRGVLSEFPENEQAKIGLGRAAIKAGDTDTAGEILEALESRGFLEPEAEQLKSMLALAGQGDGQMEELVAAAEAAPEDLELAIRAARAQAANGDHEAALERAVKVVEVQRDGPGEQARALMVDIFRSLPDDSELTRTFRRRLTMALY